ncbi:Protein of unknown function [Pyronema omphalodes CBS 100304]|uniref:Uncharacterized protein n=1 Tax=Pyronema omphalodes (strain CBS 100304) TaxID=1076935 RepID=U4KWV1_PYROM|nr:Protein of unknown function [Pyronema omphalodes CBS 100304]
MHRKRLHFTSLPSPFCPCKILADRLENLYMQMARKWGMHGEKLNVILWSVVLNHYFQILAASRVFAIRNNT